MKYLRMQIQLNRVIEDQRQKIKERHSFNNYSMCSTKSVCQNLNANSNYSIFCHKKQNHSSRNYFSHGTKPKLG